MTQPRQHASWDTPRPSSSPLPYLSPLSAARASQRAGGGCRFLLLLDGDAMAIDADGRYLDGEGRPVTRDDLRDGGYAPGPVEEIEQVTAAMALAAVIRQLIAGEASIADLSALSGRCERQVRAWLATDLPLAGWSVQTRALPGEGPGRRPVVYSISQAGRCPDPPTEE